MKYIFSNLQTEADGITTEVEQGIVPIHYKSPTFIPRGGSISNVRLKSIFYLFHFCYIESEFIGSVGKIMESYLTQDFFYIHLSGSPFIKQNKTPILCCPNRQRNAQSNTVVLKSNQKQFQLFSLSIVCRIKKKILT